MHETRKKSMWPQCRSDSTQFFFGFNIELWSWERKKNIGHFYFHLRRQTQVFSSTFLIRSYQIAYVLTWSPTMQ
jgi:hypothetical protein